jgi:hypothetical protein
MQKDMQNMLSGKDNSRLNETTPMHREDTAAWNETKNVLKPSKVSIPSELNVEQAKEWVDDGSRL